MHFCRQWRTLTVWGLGLTLLPALSCAQLRPVDPASPAASTKSRVALLENPDLVNRFEINAPETIAAFNRCFLAYTKSKSLQEAWSQFVTPQDVVGIHISCAGGSVLSTHHALVKAVVEGLQQAGIPASHIIVWDKFSDQMISAGYVPMQPTLEWQCKAVVPDTGFDPQKFYFHEVVGQLIWGDLEFKGKAPSLDALLSAAALDKKKNAPGPGDEETKPRDSVQISNRSYFCNILTRQVTKVINIPVLSDHQKVGLNGCLSSLALASIDNTRRFQDSSQPSALAIAEILGHEALKGKVVLHIVDGLIAQFAGGPEFAPHYAASPGIIAISQDPVALDQLSLQRLEKWREERKVVPIGNDALHIKQCAKARLGTNDPGRMEIITVK